MTFCGKLSTGKIQLENITNSFSVYLNMFFFLGLLKSKTFLDVRYTCICCSRHVLNNIKYYGNVFANNAISMVITKYIPDLKRS